ncbi:hypothetical protein niasHT_037809 [Heterodera trifolii]|uniref:ShKT domain-containing protein n=1 Tax=Heterodera trifolii TaxID=157864 RepID=A0ABD2ISG1_9BILA
MTVSSSSSGDSAMAKDNIITVPLQYRHHSDKINNSSRRRNGRTISDVPHSMPSFVAIISTLCCFLLSGALASPSPYYSSNYYPLYPNSLRSNYGSFYPPYSTGVGASSFYGGKPSYAYVSPYSGGYAAGISAYEGPSYGTNTYWQPGIAVPPYGATGYGNGGLGAYGAGVGGPFPYGGGAGMGGAYGDLCRSADCAMIASAGQCALCPQSCGVGCFGGSSATAGAGLLYPPSLSPYYEQQAYGQSGTAYGTGGYGGPANVAAAYGGGPVIDQNSASGYGSLSTEGAGYGYGAGNLNGYGYGGYGIGPVNGAGYGGALSSFACRDSHIYGCQQWAAQGMCQQTPEYMLNYCRASCDLCNTNSGGLATVGAAPYGSPFGANGYGGTITTGGGIPPASPGAGGFGTNGYGSLPYGGGSGTVGTPYSSPLGANGYGGTATIGGGIPGILPANTGAGGFGTNEYGSPPYGGGVGGTGAFPAAEYGSAAGQGFGNPSNGNFGPLPMASTQFVAGPFPASQTIATMDQYGTNLADKVSPTASLSAPNSFYSPFSPFSRSLHSAASTTTAVASERKQEKEKQQRGAKVLFNEDASSNSDEPSSAWTSAGLPSSSISGTSSGSIFDQLPSRISSADGIGTSSSSLTTPNWLHPFSHQLQQHSKVIRMDDLVMDKTKHSKKMTTS